MQRRVRTLKWPVVFFGCGALSAAIGCWDALGGRLAASPSEWGWRVAWAAVVAAHVTMTARLALEARDAGSPRLQRLAVLAGGIALLMVSASFRLR